jgi:hypothetical protein
MSWIALRMLTGVGVILGRLNCSVVCMSAVGRLRLFGSYFD